MGADDRDGSAGDLEVVDVLELLAGTAPAPLAPPPAHDDGPVPGAGRGRARRRVWWLATAAVAVAVAVVASLAPDASTEAPEASPSTLDIGEAEAPPGTGTAAEPDFGAALFAVLPDRVVRVDLDTGDEHPVDLGRLADPIDELQLLDAAAGTALFEARSANRYAVLPSDAVVPVAGTAAVLNPAGAVLVTAGDRVARGAFGAAGPFDGPRGVPLPEGHTLAGATLDWLLLRSAGGGLVAWRPADASDDVSGEEVVVLPGDAPRVLDAVENRYAWTEARCRSEPQCPIHVSDIDDRVTVRAAPGRRVTGLALDPSGTYLGLVARDGAVAFVALGGSDGGGPVEWLSLGTPVTGPLVWRPDGERAFVVADDPPRVVAVDPDDGAATEVALSERPAAIAWAGPSARGGPEPGRTDLVPLAGDWFPFLAGAPSGVQVAIDDRAGAGIVVVDLDSGRAHPLPGSARLVDVWSATALPGGWVASGNDGVWWFPDGGRGRRLAGTRHGGEIRGDTATGEVFLVEYRSSAVRYRRFDPATATLGQPVDVYHDNVAGTIGGRLVVAPPPQIDAPSEGAILFSPETREQRYLSAPEPGMWPWVAAADRIVWGTPRCRTGATCRAVVTDGTATQVLGELRSVNQNLRPAVSPDGRFVAVGRGAPSAPGRVGVLDLATGAWREAVADEIGWQSLWTVTGWFAMFVGDGQLALLAPGATEFRDIPAFADERILAAR